MKLSLFSAMPPQAKAVRFGNDDKKPQGGLEPKQTFDEFKKQWQEDDNNWVKMEVQAKALAASLVQLVKSHGFSGVTSNIMMPYGTMQRNDNNPRITLQSPDLGQAEAMVKKLRSMKADFKDISAPGPTSRKSKAVIKELKAAFKRSGMDVTVSFLKPAPETGLTRPILYVANSKLQGNSHYGKDLEPVLKNLPGATPGPHEYYTNVQYKGHDVIGTPWGMHPVATFKHKDHDVAVYTKPD